MAQAADPTQQALSYVRHQASKGLPNLATLMERTGADCARCLEGVSDEQAEFKYDSEWSVKEVLAHMLSSGAAVNRQISDLSEGRPVSWPFGQRPAESLEGQAAPRETRSVGELRKALAGLFDETRELVASLPDDARLKQTFQHPMFGSLDLKEWIVFQRLHALDHVQQIEKAKAAPGYPAG